MNCLNCVYCNQTFTRKDNLRVHIINKKCSLDPEKLWDVYKKLTSNSKNITSGSTSTVINNGTIINNNIQNIQIININPANKLNVEYIDTNHMKKLIENYTQDKSNLLLSGYIKNIIHNKDHPENHCVKYINKRPPTFENVIEQDGEEKVLLKNLKDSCELLSDPILKTLRKKLRECNRNLKDDEDFQDNYEDTLKDIWQELNKEAVKNALSTVLKNDILNDIDMICKKVK